MVEEQSHKALCEERLIFGGITILVRLSAQDSGGTAMVLEEVPPVSATSFRSREDELFYVVEEAHLPAHDNG